MAAEFDLDRLTQIQEVMGVEMSELVGGMLDSMRRAVEQTESAMRRGELDQAAKAAHSCRNDALMLGAKPMLGALGALEQAARAGDTAEAQDALESLRVIWPTTEAKLTRFVSDP